MVGAGIFNGDRVFVNVCNTASNGDTVVALVDDSATVKTFYKENGHFRLQPENDSMDPIIVDHVDILGKVYTFAAPKTNKKGVHPHAITPTEPTVRKTEDILLK